MKVAELVAFLQQQPQELTVAFELHSELMLLDADMIMVQQHCEPRPDGWIQRKRPDKPTLQYLVFPGN